jgi:hypothetical protein
MTCSLPSLAYPVLLLTWHWSQINDGCHDGSQSHENGGSEQTSPSFRLHDGQPQPNPCVTQTQLPATACFLRAGGLQHEGESLCHIQWHRCEDATVIAYEYSYIVHRTGTLRFKCKQAHAPQMLILEPSIFTCSEFKSISVSNIQTFSGSASHKIYHIL